ncbi:hypothetical protein [Rhodococcus qingshengii]|uniref:Uncharacterized protein n=1 Tax=Rhodococcus qingshengii TaxID=334542 RepID=A0A2A5J212_RHOSG|nr:hypothetical protein [Rhodococcus qingshengii]PCK23277.1 hypothetical protein CHR55_30370 [Rhodococcus qingshengii]
MTVTDQAFVHPSEQAEARGTHYIEGAVQVYLMRDLDGTDAWVVDPSSFGESLYSDHDKGLENGECRCGNPAECEAVKIRMAMANLPDGEELMHMLADSLGYTVTKH